MSTKHRSPASWWARRCLYPFKNRLNLAGVRAKARPLREPLLLWVATTLFGVLYSIAIYHTLLQKNPKIGAIVLSATDTNYIVSILSQFFATLVEKTLDAVLDALRWALTARESGLSFSNFVQLSGASDVFVAATVMFASNLRSCAGIARLLLPVGSLFFSSILKFKADFERYFIPESSEHQVFAGLMPIDTRVLSIVPTSYICLYFTGWIPSLLGNPKYATPVSIDGCSQNCTSVFLPGGLEVARKVRPILNATILEGGDFNNAEAIRVNNAPGVLLKFDHQEKLRFDLSKDCSYYGAAVNDTIQVCIADRNGSIAVGWAACPTALQLRGLCDTESCWKRDFNQTVLLSAFRQNATTTYSRQDLQIRKVSITSPAIHQTLNRTQFQPIWDKIFEVSNSSSETETDRIQIRSLLYSLAWLLRLYTDVFPDDPFTPLTHLQNFLAIPLQFSTVCSQFANYTVGEKFAGSFPMSDDMLTTAESGREADRLISQAWTVYTFIAASITFTVLTGALLVYMLCSARPLPRATGIPEVDILTLAGDSMSERDRLTMGKINFETRVHELPVRVLGSARKITKKLSTTRLHLISPGRTLHSGGPDLESPRRNQ